MSPTHADSSSDEDEVTSRPPAAVRQLRALTPPQRAAADRSALARQQLLVRALIILPYSPNKPMTYCDTHRGYTEGHFVAGRGMQWHGSRPQQCTGS